ncbi:hypothetical protein ABZP36_020373 [Zizania latifolia]
MAVAAPRPARTRDEPCGAALPSNTDDDRQATEAWTRLRRSAGGGMSPHVSDRLRQRRPRSGTRKRKMAPPPAVAWGHAGDRGRTWGSDRPIDRAGSFRVQWPTGRPAAAFSATAARRRPDARWCPFRTFERNKSPRPPCFT